MNYFDNNQSYVSMAEGFMGKVYGWMTIGLCVTAASAYFLSPAFSPQLFFMVSQYLIILGLIQFGLAMYFSFAWQTSSYPVLAAIFVLYSFLTGVVLSPLAYTYTGDSIFQVFLTAAAMFAVMAIYGSVTKSDLSSMRNILFMGLIGLLVANVLNIFIGSEKFNILMSCCGVGIFSLLTAYDVQMLRNLGSQTVGTKEEINKIALVGALSLYLNLINLFIYLLQLFGKRRND